MAAPLFSLRVCQRIKSQKINFSKQMPKSDTVVPIRASWDALGCTFVECGGAVVRAPALKSQGCEFNSHWVSTLATLGKLLT